MRAKEQRGAKSAGGLKVKALGWTPRDLGSSPSRRSTFPALIFASREYYLIHKLKQMRNDIRYIHEFGQNVLTSNMCM